MSSLNRFIEAQEFMYDRALKEIAAGRKRSHWMWYIFPQIQGLGKSATAIKYAVQNKNEAQAYISHPILGDRLLEISKALLNVDGKTAHDIFDSPDDMKLKSCMTLFDIVSPKDISHEVLIKYFKGEHDNRTIHIINKN